NFIETYAAGRYSTGATKEMYERFNDHIHHLPISYLESRHTGDLVSRITNGITAIHHFIRDDLLRYVFEAFRVTASIVVMAFLNWKLLLVSLTIIPFMIILVNRM